VARGEKTKTGSSSEGATEVLEEEVQDQQEEQAEGVGEGKGAPEGTVEAKDGKEDDKRTVVLEEAAKVAKGIEVEDAHMHRTLTTFAALETACFTCSRSSKWDVHTPQTGSLCKKECFHAQNRESWTPQNQAELWNGTVSSWGDSARGTGIPVAHGIRKPQL
jgi:hypothetical protein